MGAQKVIMHEPSNPISPQAQALRLLDYLTRPHFSLHDLEMRRQSRLLAALTLTLLVTSSLSLILLVTDMHDILRPTLILLAMGMTSTLIIYLANRRGYYRSSALLFMCVNIGITHLGTIATGNLVWFLFGSMVITTSGILMPLPFTIALFAFSCVTQILYAIVQPTLMVLNNRNVLIIFGVTSSLMLVYIINRMGLERDRENQLRQANADLRKSEAELEKRVAERTQELVIAKEQAEDANRIKSQFLASMSHELRTPLNAILAFNELMALGTFGEVNAEQYDYLQKSSESGRHLLALINDVLDITKIQAGMMKLFIEPGFNVSTELNNIAATTEKMLQGKPVALIRDIDANIPFMTCDKRRVRQVLINLISNAVKFTEQGSITLSAKKRPGSVLFAVIDTGPGIPPEAQTMIFEPFIQTESGIKHAGGTGLGLPISQSLVTAHGGRLWVESEPGQGAAFFVSLPLMVTPKEEKSAIE